MKYQAQWSGRTSETACVGGDATNMYALGMVARLLVMPLSFDRTLAAKIRLYHNAVPRHYRLSVEIRSFAASGYSRGGSSIQAHS